MLTSFADKFSRFNRKEIITEELKGDYYGGAERKLTEDFRKSFFLECAVNKENF